VPRGLGPASEARTLCASSGKVRPHPPPPETLLTIPWVLRCTSCALRSTGKPHIHAKNILGPKRYQNAHIGDQAVPKGTLGTPSEPQRQTRDPSGPKKQIREPKRAPKGTLGNPSGPPKGRLGNPSGPLGCTLGSPSGPPKTHFGPQAAHFGAQAGALGSPSGPKKQLGAQAVASLGDV
jgi:hypothetical protein